MCIRDSLYPVHHLVQDGGLVPPLQAALGGKHHLVADVYKRQTPYSRSGSHINEVLWIFADEEVE